MEAEPDRHGLIERFASDPDRLAAMSTKRSVALRRSTRPQGSKPQAGLKAPVSCTPPSNRSASQATMVRDGGVFRYSTTCGSMPAFRIIAKVLRDVPQAGLW